MLSVCTLALSLLPAAPAPQNGYQLAPGDLIIADAGSWIGDDRHSVKILHRNGAIETIVSGTSSILEFPSDVIIDRDGSLLVASYWDQGSGDIFRIDPSTSALTALNGQTLFEPFQMVRDTQGDLVVTDGHAGLARIDENGQVSWFSAPSALPRLDFGIALDYDGSFFVSEPPGYNSGAGSDGILWSVDPAGVRTLLCQNLQDLPEPKGLALDRDGTLLVADGLDYPSMIRHGLVRVDRAGQTQVLEWNGLTTPMDVEVLAKGDHLLADKGDESVLRYHAGGGTTRVISEHDDGNPSNMLPVDRPYGIAIVPWLWLRTPMTVSINQAAVATVTTLPAFAGSDVLLAVSSSQLATPMAAWWPSDLQTSFVDLNQAQLIRKTVPPNGEIAFSSIVPNNPNLVGGALHLQAFLPSRRLVSNYVALPVR